MTVLVLLVTLTLGLLVVPRASYAQQPGQMPRIGFVEPGSAAVNGHFLAAFRQGLRAFGWVEGQNLVIEDRWAEGQYERFPALLAELLQLKVQVIVVSSGVGTLAAKQATATVPIVGSVSIELIDLVNPLRFTGYIGGDQLN